MGWRERRRHASKRGVAWPSASSENETTVQQQIRCEFRRIRRLVWMTTLALCAVLVIGGTIADFRSCRRSAPTRHALRAAARYWQSHGRPDLARAVNAPRIDCFHFPPGE